MTETQQVRVTLTRQDGYRFTADWGMPEAPPGVLDEAPPVGQGAGPNPSRLIASAVAHCLSSSLLFCLEKSRAPARSVTAVATAEIARNERGRWRLARIRVELSPDIPEESRAAFARCQGLFEEFCIVTESVRHGVPVDVSWSAETPRAPSGPDSR